ncbi:MAG: Gfo/Idh/MocA family oxidoreductase [Proteobacteria bacterium]|nr:Gfo/Idh/MocA family oxidoreductase [Pseudomonadota bacterium]
MSAEGSAPGAAVVGTGFGVFTHLRALRQAGFEVRALVGRDPGRTRSRAQLLSVPRACTSLGEALEDPAIGVVTIATPPATHAPLVLEAVAAGRHVLCEKPFAMDSAEAARMLAAAESAGVVHALGVEFRFATAHELLRRAIAAGEIGVPRQGLFAWLVPMLSHPQAGMPDWWCDREQGGGFLGAWGSHLIDQVRVTLGEFVAVSAQLQTLSGRAGMSADDTFSAQFRLANGLEGVFVESMAAPGDMFGIVRISGSEGAAWIEGVQGEEVWVADRLGNRKRMPVPDDIVLPPPLPFPHGELMQSAYEQAHAFGTDLAPYTRLFERMRARIAGRSDPGSPPFATFADGLACQQVLDAMRDSARGERWVNVGDY